MSHEELCALVKEIQLPPMLAVEIDVDPLDIDVRLVWQDDCKVRVGVKMNRLDLMKLDRSMVLQMFRDLTGQIAVSRYQKENPLPKVQGAVGLILNGKGTQ